MDVLLVLMGTVIFYLIGMIPAWFSMMYFCAKLDGDTSLGGDCELIYGSWLIAIILTFAGSVVLFHKKYLEGIIFEDMTSKFMTKIVENDMKKKGSK